MLCASLERAILTDAELSDAKLRGATLDHAVLTDARKDRANLHNLDLTGADLTGADLRDANLSGADLTNANLNRANLNRASLVVANLDHADLGDANLREVFLSDADLMHANLRGANLTDTNLTDAYLTGASLCATIFANVNLSGCRGLDSCHHLGPSALDHRTFLLSGALPEAFLRGCGVSNELITHLLSLLQLDRLQRHHSFVSYSSKDQDFADRLHVDLQAQGVRCWLVPHGLEPGDLDEQIDRALCHRDRVLLILSDDSMASPWVEREIKVARVGVPALPGEPA